MYAWLHIRWLHVSMTQPNSKPPELALFSLLNTSLSCIRVTTKPSACESPADASWLLYMAEPYACAYQHVHVLATVFALLHSNNPEQQH